MRTEKEIKEAMYKAARCKRIEACACDCETGEVVHIFRDAHFNLRNAEWFLKNNGWIVHSVDREIRDDVYYIMIWVM